MKLLFLVDRAQLTPETQAENLQIEDLHNQINNCGALKSMLYKDLVKEITVLDFFGQLKNEKYEKLLAFVKKASLPDHTEEHIQKIYLDGYMPKQMIAAHALEARHLLKEIGEANA